MYNSYPFTPEEEKLFEDLEKSKNKVFDLCRKLRRLAVNKIPKEKDVARDMVFELLPNSSDLYEITESYKKRYIAASIIIDSGQLPKVDNKPVLKLISK